MKKIFLLAGVFALLSLPSVKAQVTIGMQEVPIDGALLQLKNTEATDSAANATKGFAYPRVSLTSLTELYPMFGAAGAETGNYSAEKTALKASHSGLTVYNVNTAAPFMEGLYTWSGTRWLAGTVVAKAPGQFMEWNGEAWALASHDSINPVKRLIIPLDEYKIVSDGRVYYGTIQYSEADPAQDAFSVLSVVPVIVSSPADPWFVANNMTLSTAVRRTSNTAREVVWKLKIANDYNSATAGGALDTDAYANVNSVYINYTSTGGVFKVLGSIRASQYKGY